MDQKEIIKRESLPSENVDNGSEVRSSEETLYSLGKQLQDRRTELISTRERSQWEREKAESFEAYHMAEKTRTLPFSGAANMTCVLPRIGVDAIHANNMQAIFGPSFRAKVRPKWAPPSFQATSKRAADFLSFQLEHEAHFYEVFDDADRKAQMYGIGYLEPYYVKENVWETASIVEERNVPVTDPLTGEVSIQVSREERREKKKKTVFDGIRIDSIPVEKIYVSPFVRTIEDAVLTDVLFKDFSLTLSMLEDRARGENSFYIKEKVNEIKERSKKRKMASLSELEMARARQDGFFLDRLVSKESIDLSEAHLWTDIDNDGILEKVTVTFHPESATILRCVLSPCRIVELRPRPVDERFYGEGIPKISLQIIAEWEEIHNTRVNAGKWENCPFGFYQSGGRLNPREFTITPGHFYPVDNPREISFANTPTVRSSYFQEEGLLLNYFERLLGISENIQGVHSRRAGSATENIEVSKKAAVRFANPLNREVIALEKLLGHMWDLNRECAPSEKEYFVVGAGNTTLFDKVRKDDYNVQLSFRLSVSTIFDEQLSRDTSLLVYRLFMGSPMIQSHPGVLYDLHAKTLDALDFDLSIPKPSQARILSPLEEHEIFKEGKDVEPQVGEDYDDHLKQHMALLQSDAVREWDPASLKRLILHIDKTTLLKGMLESANLNQSGIAERADLPGMPSMPSMTASRNPSQRFNTMRIGEGRNGGNAQETLSSFTNRPQK